MNSKTGLTTDQAIEKTFEIIGFKVLDDEMSEILGRRFLDQNNFAQMIMLYDNRCKWVNDVFAFNGKPSTLREYFKQRVGQQELLIVEQAFMINQPDMEDIISKAAEKITDKTFGRNGETPSMEMFHKLLSMRR